jgi:hypothetical protein
MRHARGFALFSVLKRHEALVTRWGEERVMSGDYPGNARKRDSVLTMVPLEPETTMVTSMDANGSEKTADPTSVRPALAQLAAENLDELQRALLDAALSATTTKWAKCLRLRGELEQVESLRDQLLPLADELRHLRYVVALLDEPPVGVRFLERVEVGPDHVLGDRERERLSIGVAHPGRAPRVASRPSPPCSGARRR